MLSDVQLFNLVLVKEIDEICKKYDIDYYLAGGSVIGILRHKGFIPWDDDMDLYMTRDNWHKFREAFDKEKPKDRILESSDINPNYPNMIAKYTSTNTTAIYKNLLSGNYAAGVIVDILILDPVPSDEAIQQQHLKNLLLYSEFVNRYYVFSHRFDIDVDFDTALARESEIGHEAIVREYEKLVTQYSEEESDTYVLRWGGVPHTFAKDLFGTPKFMPFEGIMLPVPQKAFLYLSQLYGEDWIQLPQLEDEISHDAVFSIEKPYSEFFREFSPHFKERDYLANVMGRKRNRIKAGRSYRAVQDSTLEFECRRLIMRYKQLDQERNLRAMYDAGEFDQLQELYEDYFNGQCTSRMFGNKYYGGVYRYFHPKYADIGDDLAWIAIELLSRQGRLHHPKRIAEACQFSKGGLCSEMADQKRLIDEMISIIDAFEQGRYAEVASRAAAAMWEKPDWINFIKLRILALQAMGYSDKQVIRDLVEAGKAVAPEDGDWLKYEADTYLDEDPARADVMYEEARQNTRNGATLLAIDEHFGKDGEEQAADSAEADAEADVLDIQKVQESDLSDAQKVHLQLMREIADICNAIGIRYYLSNRSALLGYVNGGVTNEATSPTMLIHVEDSLAFAEEFEKRHLENRILDSMLTNNRFPTFSFRYVDTTTLCLSTRQLGNFQNHGMYVHIGFLEHMPSGPVRRFASMLKTGWYDVNCVNARGTSVQVKSKLAQGYVSKAFDVENDAAVGGRMFRTLVKLYSTESDSYQLNETSLKRVKFDAEMIDGVQETVDICGTTFTTVCDTLDYLKRMYTRQYETVALKPRPTSVYRIVDPHISYEAYCEANDDLITDDRYQQDVFENRFYNAMNLKFKKRIDDEWKVAMYIGRKWELADTYEEEKDLIDELYAKGDFEDLADILLPYIGHFNRNREDIVPFYNDHLLDICEVFLYETERYGRLEKLLEKRETLTKRQRKPKKAK